MFKFFIKHDFKTRLLLFATYVGRFALPKSIAIILLILISLQNSCDSSVGPGDDPPPLPDDAAVYVSMDGTEAGLWILNANSLELIDSMITAPGVPWTIEFSPDYSTWYSCWGRGADYAIYSCAVNPLEVSNSVPLQYANSSLAKSQNHLVAYISKGIEVFDLATLSPITIDTSISAYYSRVTMSKNYNKFYFTKWSKSNFVGFGIYDLESMNVIDEIIVFDDIRYKGLEDVDIAVSNDDRYLFFSAWIWLGGFSGYGSFFIIDLTQKRIVEEFRVGAFSQLGMSPDGQSIYISDPGGYLYNFPSSGKVWRYDVKNNTMQVIINNLYYSDRITVADDNRTLFITPVVSFVMENGQRAWVAKVDALNRQVINYYPVTYDSTGFFTNNPRNIRMGKYTISSK